jgi:uncharacterized YigZ family protein
MSNLSGKFNDSYVTLEIAASAEITEKKSVFIGSAAPVKDEDEATAFIGKISNAHKDASHNVYAYLFDNGRIARFSDDGEPHGTAGIPVLEVIKKNGFTDAVIVVTRYFGGILLGAGGLVRAYSAAAKAAVDAAHIVTYVGYTIYKAKCGYADYQKIRRELDGGGIVTDDVAYSDEVEVTFSVKDDKRDNITKKLTDICAGKINIQVIGKKFGK